MLVLKVKLFESGVQATNYLIVLAFSSGYTERPLTLQDIETDTAKLINIGVVYLGQESNFRRCHGIVVG